MYPKILLTFIFVTILRFSLQTCPEEVSWQGITWHESKPDTSSVSEPLCYNMGRLITRHCNATGWYPSLEDLDPCFTIVETFDLSSCPPGYEQVSKTGNRYCYKVEDQSNWNLPCLTNGGASIITDLTTEEFESLLKSLQKSDLGRYFWLPGQRRKTFSPVVWSIPGPNWGQMVDSAELFSFSSMVRNCLVLDIERKIITTDSCNRQYPSLCLYLEDIKYPAKCPDGYYGFRFMSNNGTCFGIKKADDAEGLTFDDFLNGKCNKPLGNSKYNDLSKFIYMKIAEMDNMSDNIWCWFQNAQNDTFMLENQTIATFLLPEVQYAINNNGTIAFIHATTKLPCMACETQVVVNGDTALDLQFSQDELKLYLTIYFPSGLWKYDNYDIGVQCFSDAMGFSTTVNVNYMAMPIIDMHFASREDINSTNVEKSIYTVDLVTNRSAQYWCEAHDKYLSLLKSSKVIVNPRSNQLHVFALVIKINLEDNVTLPQTGELTENLTNYLNAEKVILMDILEYHVEYLLILLHVHVTVSETYEDKVSYLEETYESLKSKVMPYLTAGGYTFINISSSQYCFPTVSLDCMILEWELTVIGQVAAPKQFCLQSNGLPVKRNCLGSYLLGGRWGEVEGQCNETYEPSSTTTFLYRFVKGQVSENYTTRFLIDGLEFVLNDVDIIIPADIYYLSVSLQTFLNMAQSNDTLVDMGDVENMAWAMDRILLMDNDYLRLSQTLNSTNIILDSVNDILEKLAEINLSFNAIPLNKIYQLSVKSQFTVQISYPAFNNITGIAVSKLTDSDNFTDMLIQPLYANSSIDDVLAIENLEVATWLPRKVLDTLEKISNDSIGDIEDKKDVHIVINIYRNDAIFQELDETTHVVNSRIVGVTIPGYNTNLIHSIPLLFKELNKTNSRQKCGYWNFQSRKEDSNPGFWSTRGCFYERTFNNITVCRCYHLTHFGQLFDIGELTGGNNRTKCHMKALNVITLVGSFLSLFGIVGIFITAMVFQTWRKKPSTKVLLQLSTSIAIPLVIMVIFNLDDSIFHVDDGTYVVRKSKEIVCVALGSILHYSILASFTWMLITAILQFIRYVRVLGVCRPSRFMFKFALIGWGVPSIPVILVLALNYETYIPDPSLEIDKRICYPSGTYLVMGIIVPIALVLIVNIFLFLMVLISISQGPKGKMKTADMDLIGTQIRLSLFLFFLLGLTWIFGLFSFSGNLLWSYLFCLTSTLQGFVLFIYFVICDPATRNLWVTLMKPQFKSSSTLTPRKSISSISSG
ncbi:7 transmembrane receptor (Secretin family) domain-containing protein [Phthorimaea operculella]|nr:7 transmembrane receptor (Secretin family) domain-containing protein [Phthorimaea operculella]